MMEDKQPNVTQAVPFFMVADMEASLDFYINKLNFELKNKWEPRGRIEWCWLQIGKASLMLQEHVKEGGSATFFLDNKKGLGVSVYFMCRDAIALYHEFTAKGVEAREPIVGNGLWEFSVTDPDGYRTHFESETNVPEDTSYSDWLKSQ